MAEHVTTEELAAQYGIQRRTVDAWGRRGHVTILKRDGQRVVDPEEAARWWNEERDARMAAVRAARP